MKDMVVAVIVAILSSQALTLLVNAWIEKQKEKKKKPTAMESAVMWLLQDRLDYLMTKEVMRGVTKRQTKAFLHKGYQIYHELGGNGDMKQLIDAYDEIEVDYEH